MPTCVPTFIFVALACEAKPLITHYALKKQTEHSIFEVYQREGLILVVSGVGKTSMAAAVAYTLALYAKSPLPVCLNIGIAGHRHAALGEVYAAHKITDQDSQKHYYPQLPFSHKFCPSLSLTTVSQVQQNYAEDTLYDMEASAFFETAGRFSSSELLVCLKIISDNTHAGTTQINSKQVSNWITAQLPTIDRVLQLTQHARTAIPEVAEQDFEHLTAHIHCTVNEKQQLKQLLQRWHIMSDAAALKFTLQEIKSARQLLMLLEQQIAALPIKV